MLKWLRKNVENAFAHEKCELKISGRTNNRSLPNLFFGNLVKFFEERWARNINDFQCLYLTVNPLFVVQGWSGVKGWSTHYILLLANPIHDRNDTIIAKTHLSPFMQTYTQILHFRRGPYKSPPTKKFIRIGVKEDWWIQLMKIEDRLNVYKKLNLW